MVNQSFWSGLLLILGTLVGLAGGAGIAISNPAGNRAITLLIGFGFLVGGSYLVNKAEFAFRLFGMGFNGDTLVLVAFCLAWFTTRHSDRLHSSETEM